MIEHLLVRPGRRSRRGRSSRHGPRLRGLLGRQLRQRAHRADRVQILEGVEQTGHGVARGRVLLLSGVRAFRQVREGLEHVGSELVGVGLEPLLLAEGPERGAQLGGALIAILGPHRERLADDLEQRLRHLRVEVPQLRDLALAHHHQRGEVAATLEEALGREHLPQADAEGEDVAAAVKLGQPARLLGREVSVLALEQAGLGAHQLLAGLGDAEVDQLHRARVGHQNVLGRDVAVDDPEGRTGTVGQGVGVLQRIADLARDMTCQVDWQWLVGFAGRAQQDADIHAVDILEGDVVAVFDAAGLQGPYDPRMVQPQGELRLVHEHGHVVGLVREARKDALERDEVALMGLFAGLEDLRHAARAQPCEQLVLTEDHGLS